MDDAWLTRLDKSEDSASTLLLVVPHAGAGPLAFKRWPAEFSDDVELLAVHLPGRERRIREDPAESIVAAAAAVVRALMGQGKSPHAIFGHSMGALLALEIAHQLRLLGKPASRLFVSGSRPPHLLPRDAPLSTLPTPLLIRELQRLGGLIPGTVENAELLSLVLPIIRADCAMLEKYRFDADPLPRAIVGFCGSADDGAPREDMIAWAHCTTKSFVLHEFPGGHFFVEEQRARVCEVVNTALHRDTRE